MSLSAFIPLRMPRYPFVPGDRASASDMESQWQLAASLSAAAPVYLGVDAPALLSLEQHSPEEAQRLAAAVAAGGVLPLLGVAALPERRLMAEQLCAAQLFLHQRLGRICDTAFVMPHALHLAWLPQLLRLAGVARLLVCLPETADLTAAPAFLWEGENGGKVLCTCIHRKRMTYLADAVENALGGDAALQDLPVLSGALPLPDDAAEAPDVSDLLPAFEAFYAAREDCALAHLLADMPDAAAPMGDARRRLCFLQAAALSAALPADAAKAAAATVLEDAKASAAAAAAALAAVPSEDRARFAAVEVTAGSVQTECVKTCDDGSGDLILRLRETAGKETRAAVLVDALEAAFWVDLAPYELRVLRIGQDGRALDVNLLENIVPQRSEEYPD